MQNRTFDRNRRLEGEMRAVLAELLRFEVKDPRLTDVTVSQIRLSADRSIARVYFSVLGGNEEREQEAADGFEAASAFMRRQLGSKMHLRVVPTLHFERDASFEYGDRMERLFDRMAADGLLNDDDNDASEPEEGP